MKGIARIVFGLLAVVVSVVDGYAQEPVREWKLKETFHVTEAQIGSEGRMYVVDEEQAQVRIFDSTGGLVRAVGRKGRGPGEFQDPLAMALSPDEERFAVREKNGRVSLFARDGTFQQSFVATGILPSGSSSMTFLSDSLLAIGGFKPESLYTGEVIHRYTTDGTPVSSFLGRTEKAKKLKVTGRVGVGFDRYRNRLYAIRPVDYAIAVLTFEGERTRTIRVSPLPEHFQAPTTPQPDPRTDRAGAIEWTMKSDALRRLFVLSEELLLVTVQKRVKTEAGYELAFQMDVIDAEEGRVVRSRWVEGWVVDADPERGWVYVAEAQEDAPVTMLRAYRVEDLVG